jgi:hypothetical protein
MFPEHFKKNIEKLQNLPEQKKKIILWVIVVIVALPLIYLWINSATNSFSKIGQSIKIPQIPVSSTTPEVTSLDASKSINATDWKIYLNKEYGITISYPNNWSAGVSILFPNVVLFCPPEHASADPDVICKMKEGTGKTDTQAPITFSLIQKKMQLVDNNSTYEEVFKQMEKSLNSIK